MNPEQMKRSYDRRRSTIGKEKDKDTLALANKLAEMHLHAHEYSEAEQYVKLKIEVSKDEKGTNPRSLHALFENLTLIITYVNTP